MMPRQSFNILDQTTLGKGNSANVHNPDITKCKTCLSVLSGKIFPEF